MRERHVDIKTADGVMDTFITHPETGGSPFPVVIVYMDIWGVREELYDVARRIGTVGYYAMVPDLYYRWGKVSFDFRNDAGQALSGFKLDPENRKKVSELWQKLTNKMAMDDTAAILDFLNREEHAHRGGMGSLGYCMGGRHVLCAAGEFPERFVAGASLHGTRMLGDTLHGPAPLRLANRFNGELYCGFAEHDQHMSLDQIREMEAILAPYPVTYRYTVHPGAIHGYSLPERDVYDKQAAERDWEHIFAMYLRQIPPPGLVR
jgi:carboxymethylenebutenolidase